MFVPFFLSSAIFFYDMFLFMISFLFGKMFAVRIWFVFTRIRKPGRRNYDWIYLFCGEYVLVSFSVWMASLYLARREGIAPDSQAPYQTPMTTSQNTTLSSY